MNPTDCKIGMKVRLPGDHRELTIASKVAADGLVYCKFGKRENQTMMCMVEALVPVEGEKT